MPDYINSVQVQSKEADLLFHDSQYNSEEYEHRVGWGHCSVGDAVDFGNLSKVKKMVLFHHDPAHTDKQLEAMVAKSIHGKNIDFDLVIGKENDVFIYNGCGHKKHNKVIIQESTQPPLSV